MKVVSQHSSTIFLPHGTKKHALSCHHIPLIQYHPCSRPLRSNTQPGTPRIFFFFVSTPVPVFRILVSVSKIVFLCYVLGFNINIHCRINAYMLFCLALAWRGLYHIGPSLLVPINILLFLCLCNAK